MTRKVTVCLVCTVAAVALLAAEVSAQSLADISRVEEARRSAIRNPARVYTNADLGGRGLLTTAAPRPRPVTTPTDGASAPSSATGPAPDAPAGTQPQASAGQRDEAYWRNRISAVQEQIARSEIFRDAMQNRIDSLQADFTARDDPAQRAVIFSDRQQALDELAGLGAEIERLNEEIASIRDEARRAGVPPGWLR